MEKQSESVKALNGILKTEISAVETYKQALEKLEDSSHREKLLEVERTHEDHVNVLRDRIMDLGGSPARGGGAWGAFAKVVQGGAKLFGDRAAIAALEEGEDHALHAYREHLGELDPDSRVMIEETLLPEQEQTHFTLRLLKRMLH